MARLLMKALQMKGHYTTVASQLRSWEGNGNVTVQERIRRRGVGLAQRFVQRHAHSPPDLWFTYHLYHKAPDWIGPTVAHALGIPYIVAEASVAPKQSLGPWAIGHQAVELALAKTNCVIALNPADVECLRPVLKDSRRLAMMLPFINTAQPRRAAAQRDQHRSELAHQLGIDPEIPWIVAVAMMRDGDKLDSYRILGRLLRRLGDIEWSLLVVGDGPARAQVEKMIGLSDRVRYLGIQTPLRVFEINAAADLFCWPAVNEAYGMALLEAQASGLPVVAGSSPGVAQIITDGITGSLAPAGNMDLLCDLVRDLLLAPNQRKAMRKAALKTTLNLHDISVAATRLDNIFRGAISRTKR